MEFKEIIQRAKEIRSIYADLERKKYGREWTREEIVQGFVGDVGDLMKISMAKEGVRNMPDVDMKLAHELADCLWSIIIIADKYGVDLGGSFAKTMDELEQRVKSEL